MYKNIKVEAEHNCGIYCLFSNIDDRIYIGSSKNIQYRLNYHFKKLISNNHTNSHLQNFINKYSIKNLDYKILENCLEKELISREQYYIDNNKNLFNISKIAGKVEMNEETKNKLHYSMKGKPPHKNTIEAVKISSKNRIYTSEMRKIRSENMKRIRKESNNYNFKGERNSSSKLKDYQVFEILELLNTKIKQTEIAKIYNVSKYCISLIKNNKSYKHIERCSNQ